MEKWYKSRVLFLRMKFVVSQQEFSKALTLSGKSLLSKANLPILSNLLITATKNSCEIISTNLETATKVNIKCNVEVEGKTTLVGKTLLEFVSQLPEGDVVFEKLGEEVVVSQTGYKARMATIAAEEFPAIPKIDSGINIKIVAGDFVRVVTKVAFSAAQDEARPILTGVLCEFEKSKLSMVATDGYRLSHMEIACSPSSAAALKLVIPARALIEVAKIIAEMAVGEGEEKGQELELLVAESLNQINFKINNVEFTSRLIDGDYPGWQKVIPAAFSSSAKLTKEEFLKLVRVASIFARDAGSIIRLRLEADKSGKKGMLTIMAAASQVGSSDASCEVDLTGAGGEIAFNYRYLLDVLGVIDCDTVSFEMVESLNPGKLTEAEGAKDNFFHIIMPVRLQG